MVARIQPEIENALTRGQVAKCTGVGTEALRFYEKQGLLPEPKRDVSGYRRYTPEMVQQIRFVTHAKELGFTLQEIKELIELKDLAEDNCISICRRVDAKIAEVERKIRTLTLLKKCLKRLSAACDGRQPIESCPIFHFIEQMERLGQDCLTFEYLTENKESKPEPEKGEH